MIGIIGSEGFVGNALKQHLRGSTAKLCFFDLRFSTDTVEFLDISAKIQEGKFNGVRTLINLAAEHRDDVRPLDRYFLVNVKGAEAVCEAASEAGVERIIFTSSVAVYGFAPPNTDESGDIKYFNEYGRTKFLAEQVYKAWQAESPESRSLVIVRPTVIFGPGNRGNVYNLLSQIASRKFIMFGNGKNVKSMAYVHNVAKFLAHSLSSVPGIHTYNYVDKPDLDMNALVAVARSTLFSKQGVGFRLPAFFGVLIGLFFDLLSKVLRRSLPISSIRVKKFMSTTQFSSAANKTGFEPDFTLAEGLKKTLVYEFIEDNSSERTFQTE